MKNRMKPAIVGGSTISRQQLQLARPWIGSGHKYTRQKIQNRVQSNTTYHCLFLIQVQFAGCVMNAWMNGIAMDVRVDHGLDIAYG